MKPKNCRFSTMALFPNIRARHGNAERQADKIGAEIGVDLKLADNWREYQEDEITDA